MYDIQSACESALRRLKWEIAADARIQSKAVHDGFLDAHMSIVWPSVQPNAFTRSVFEAYSNMGEADAVSMFRSHYLKIWNDVQHREGVVVKPPVPVGGGVGGSSRVLVKHPNLQQVPKPAAWPPPQPKSAVERYRQQREQRSRQQDSDDNFFITGVVVGSLMTDTRPRGGYSDEATPCEPPPAPTSSPSFDCGSDSSSWD